MKSPTSIRKRLSSTALLFGVAVALVFPAGALGSGPVFDLDIDHTPTRLAPGKPALYLFTVQNLAATPSAGAVTVQIDPLPDGITATDLRGASTSGTSNWSCDLPSLSCTTESVVGPGRVPTEVSGYLEQTAQIRLTAAVDPGANGTKQISASVSGGGAQAAAAEVGAFVSEDPPAFGIVPGSLEAEAYDHEGAPLREAGATPFVSTVALELNSRIREGSSNQSVPSDAIRTVRTKLPRGLVGDPGATPRCPFSFLGLGAALSVGNGCSAASQVGTIDFTVLNLGRSGIQTLHAPVYNLEPPRGLVAAFGFTVYSIPTMIVVRDLDPADSSVVVEVNQISEAMPLLSQRLTLWGNPASPLHDADRLGPAFPFWGATTPAEPRAFLRMPTECNVGGTNVFQVESWEERGLFTAPQISPNPPGEMFGCDQLQFKPTIDAKPTTNLADAPSGLEFEMRIPQNQDPEGLATAHLRDATVTLPAGMTVNPPSADGLGACSPGEIGLGSNDPAACPDASKLGRVEVETPVLDRILPGEVYLAEQNNNPFGSLLAMYLAIDDPESDVIVKLAGKVTPDPVTGQLTASFKENPQMPVEVLRMKLYEGPRASLKTPSSCGTHTTTSTLVPWSSPEGADATPSSSFELTQGPSGGACLNGGSGAPNSPAFDAGTVDPTAKAFSPFVLKLARADGSQQLSKIETTLPQGLVAKLAGTTYCSDASLASAAGKSGKDERSSASCPASSRVGSVNAGAGAGSTPLHVGAQAYLAGPYQGAPLSLAIITPAVVGPFDLGTVVVRTALHVNPESAQVKAISDELPTILQGIPLNIRSVALKMDRPEFMLNPTSCDPMSVDASALSVFNQSAALTSRFQVGECNKLGFKPKLAMSFSGSTRRSAHPALRATLTARPGDANIAKAQVTLPKTEFLAQNHIRTICTRVQYAAKACPKGAVYGYAKAWTPLLDQPLEGPVYLRSSSNKLPDLVADLNGQLEVDLVGRIDSPKARIRNTFELVPDAPVSKFILTMQGGKKGLLVNNSNLCKQKPRLEATFEAQNGKVAELTPLVKTDCGKKGRKGGKKGEGREAVGRRLAPPAAQLPSPGWRCDSRLVRTGFVPTRPRRSA